MEDERGALNDDGLLVLTEGRELPERCPMCNSRHIVGRATLSIRSPNRDGNRPGSLASVVTSGIDTFRGARYTGPVEVEVPFCRLHRHRYRNRVLAGVLLFVHAAIWLAWAYTSGELARFGSIGPDVWGYFALAGAFIGMLVLIVTLSDPASAWFAQAKFVDRSVWVRGACRAYLKSLPKYRARE